MVFALAACQPTDKTTQESSSKETVSASSAESTSQPETTEASSETSSEATTSEINGVFKGIAEGHNGDIEVQVTFEKNKIEAVDITKSDETGFVSKPAYESITKAVVDNQSVQVDSTTGATVTSMAVKRAISNAIEASGADLKAFEKKVETPKSTEVVELNPDVVIAGGGASGIAAAIAADEKGLSVVLLEKNAMLGGHSAFSGGLSLITGSQLQKKLGVENDTPEEAYKDMFNNGGQMSLPELLKLYAENMGKATDWITEVAEVREPEKITKLGENKIDRGIFYPGGGAGLIEDMAKKLAKTKVDLHLDTKATGLIVENGEVKGIEAVAKDGKTYKITAKSTVLATGGYAAKKDLLPDNLKNFVYYGAGLSTGDALEFGKQVNADTIHMGEVELFENGVEWLPGIAKSTYNGSMAAWTKSGILVDRKGNRVVNERGAGITIVKKQAEQPDSILFLLMDENTFKLFREKIGGTGISEKMMDDWLKNNGTKGPIFAHADTIDEVAKIAGVDAAGLKATIEKYNGFVDAKKDADFDRPADFMTEKIGAGPYYLVEQRPRYATTLGGLLINTDLQVINADGKAVPGLYAIGDAGGGVRGNDSVPGADIGWALTSGYLMGDILKK